MHPSVRDATHAPDTFFTHVGYVRLASGAIVSVYEPRTVTPQDAMEMMIRAAWGLS